MRTIFQVFLLSIVVSVGSCENKMDTYDSVIKSGITNLSWPRKLEHFFGNGDHFITHYGMSSGPKQWNSEVFFGGRYVLTLQVDVEVLYSKGEVGKVVGKPLFILKETKLVEIGPTGTVGARFSTNWFFGTNEWNTLVASKGDWSSINIPVKTNSPVENFDYYVQELRKPRVQVPH